MPFLAVNYFKEEKMKKLIAIILTALVLCSVLSFACAAYSDNAENMPEGSVVDTENATTENEATLLGAADTEEGAKNPFEAVFEKVKERSDTIFSALTLIGSLVLAFTYKKGLLPALGASLGKIGDSVKKISDATEASITKSEGAIIDIDTRVQDIKNLFERLDEKVADLNTKLVAVDEERERGEMTRILMRSQIDMLYDIFMTSSLPQYSKDAVGERIAAMKLLLEKGGE